MQTSEQQRRTELISGIRVLADFLERHPQLPVPSALDVMAFPGANTDYALQCEEIDRFANAHDAKVRDHDGHHTASIDFGRVSYRLVAISEEAGARYDALMSYRDSVKPETGTINRPEIPTADVYGGQCPCGALADKGARLCRKCRSRGRWARRKSPRYAEGDER